MRKGFLVFVVGGVLTLLSACSQPATPTSTTDSWARLVELGPGDTRAGIEQAYGGKVVVWQPDASVAILKIDAAPSGALTTAGVQGEPNANVISVPEQEPDQPGLGTQGWTAWSGGWTAWSGGWTAWSGGWTAWSGGQAGSLEPLENHAIWHQIGLFEAHERAPQLGEGVIVAVVDTGIDLAHPIFQGHLAPASAWHDFVDGDALPQEVASGDGEHSNYGHGTAVAGIIRQVAPEATILPLRVLRPDGSGDLTAVVAAVFWAMDQDVDIINLSLGARRHSPILQFAIRLATAQGIYVVSSSGNTGNQLVTYPAARSVRHDQAGRYSLGIGSVDANDVKAVYSTYGHKLELLAPGNEVTTSAPDDRLAHWSGTSMATGVASGALALGLAEHPGQAGLAEVLADTAQSVDRFNAKKYRGKLGHGRIDVAAFLEALNH